MGKLTVKLNDKLVSVEMDDSGRYCLNDIYKASGVGAPFKPVQYLRYKRSGVEVVNLNNGGNSHQLPEDFDSYVVVTGKGRGSKTFAPLKVVYKYAGWVSKDFEDAVYSAFTEISKGNVTEAANIASSVTLTPEIISRYEKLEKALQNTIASTYPESPHIHSNFFRVITKAATGYTPKELTGGFGSTVSYIEQRGHLPAMNAYIACLQLTNTLLVAGVTDYHAIAAALGVETGKNKDVLMKAFID